MTAAIAGALTDAFSRLTFWIVADVTNHTFRADKNYHNFELVEKDPDSSAMIAKMQAKAWGRGAISIGNFQVVTGQKFTNNINVLVNVSVSYHAIYGLQLNVNEIDVNFTLGALELQRQATLTRLVEENPAFIRKVGDKYITRNKELAFGRVIQNIAVVSSATSAGWQDFRHTLEMNPFGYRFTVDDYFTIVQGEGNAQQFLSRLIDVFNSNRPYDAVVIIRGGGAQTDFLIFDDYMIGKAVAKFPIPVITGIGHQKNETIADLMAHTSTKTPTRAAEFIIDHNHAFEESVRGLQQQIIIKSQQQFSNSSRALAQVNSTIVNQSRNIIARNKDRLYGINQVTVNTSRGILFSRGRELLSVGAAVSTKPKMMVYNRLNDLRQMTANLGTFNALYWKNQKAYLGHFVSMIRIVSPESTLKRGFAIIKSNNKVTGNPDDLVIGKDIEILLSDKSIAATVKSKKEYDGNEFNV